MTQFVCYLSRLSSHGLLEVIVVKIICANIGKIFITAQILRFIPYSKKIEANGVLDNYIYIPPVRSNSTFLAPPSISITIACTRTFLPPSSETITENCVKATLVLLDQHNLNHWEPHLCTTPSG